MIAFSCPSCNKGLAVKDDHAGEQSTCPHCNHPVTVPARHKTEAPDRMTLQASPDAQPLPKASAAFVPTVAQAVPERDSPSSADVQNVNLEFLAPKKNEGELGWLGRYRVLEVLGAGGMGMVLKAEDPLLKRAIALKVMRPELAANEVQRKRFLREAQATAAIEHDHIVGIHEVGVADKVPFIAMPFLKGEALDKRLERETKLPVAAAVRMARQTAEGLATAHARGLIHRDIKPGNLWLEAPRDRVKIMDFGLAHVAEMDDVVLTKSGTILGTPAYMAPEQAMADKPVDGRCDLFSLGAVFYHVLTGERPFKGHDTMSLLMALATETPRPVRDLNPAVPLAVADLVRQLLEKDPDQRPASAKAVAEALADIENDKTQQLSISSEVAERYRISGRAGLVIKSTLGLFVLVALLYLLRPGLDPEPTPSVNEGNEKRFTNSLGMKFVLVPKGKAWLGGSTINPGHETEINYDFYLGQYEVTQEEWAKVTALDPSSVPDLARRLPVENVTWDDCQLFVRRVNAQTKETGWVYRLPNEVEWEYACRGGPMTDRFESAFDFYFEKPAKALSPDMANFSHENSLKRTTKVGSYRPNKLGLHDMHGNVWEWCVDVLEDEKGALQRVYRGGGWRDDSGFCRAACRFMRAPSFRSHNLGLRLARVPIDLADR